MTQEELEALRRDVAIVAEFEKTRNHDLRGLADAEFRIAHMYAEKLLAERDGLAKVVEVTAPALREALKAVDECYVDTGHFRVSCTSEPRIKIASAIVKAERA